MNSIKRISLFPNNNDKSIKQSLELEKKLKEKGYIINDTSFDLAIAIGGDGSFLRMAKACEFDEDLYYLGVNTGTLGFAQEIYPKEIDNFIERLVKDDYKLEDVGIEKTEVKTKNCFSSFYSLNEVLIREKDLHTTRLNIYINENLLEKFVRDGILISTSFGSTAYNLNFGGSIVYNDLHTMQITPIAPLNSKTYQVLRNSVIIPEKRKITIIPEDTNKSLMITTDGENSIFNNVEKIEPISVNGKLSIWEYDYKN